MTTVDSHFVVSNDLQVGVCKNDDKEMWPGVDATCRNCRHEWLWKKASLNPRDQEAIGGIELSSDDWETRQTVEGFVEMAEGTINTVINLAREKYWLRKFTRLDDMMQQALAAAKFNSYPSRSSSVREDAEYGNWEESLAEEDDEEEEDAELMQLEERGVKDLALGDWARTRILDGYWISPADIWFRNIVPGKAFDMPADHPCPWTIEDRKNVPHPSPAVVKAEVPPSWDLCHQACFAFGQQLRLILLPPMKNIVRRVAIECAMADGNDEATLKASRLSLEEVARVLREEEGVWFDGYDWIERRRNDEEARRSGRSGTTTREDDARSTRSTTSTTSSTNSCGSESTTPSPPPPCDMDDKKIASSTEQGFNHKETSSMTDWDMLNVSEKVIIPVDPVLNPPRILRSIPYIPRSLTHLPQYSIEAFKNIWREACAPLYHCRCRICERAVAVANAPSNQPGQPLSLTTTQKQQLQEQQRLGRRPEESPLQIRLQEVSDLEYSGEEEEDDEYEYDEDEEVDVVEVEEQEGREEGDVEAEEEESGKMVVRIPPSILANRRKRSVDEIEDREEKGRSGSPTKRQKKEKMKGGNPITTPTLAGSPIQRKRSSEELDDEDGVDHTEVRRRYGGVTKKTKRARIDDDEEEQNVRVGSLSKANWRSSRSGGSGNLTSSSESLSRSRSLSPPASRRHKSNNCRRRRRHCSLAEEEDDSGMTSENADGREEEEEEIQSDDFVAWYNAAKPREISTTSTTSTGSGSEGEGDDDDDGSTARVTSEGDRGT